MSSGYKCYNCGKGVMVGHSVSHAKNRTRKVFRPNLHVVRVIVSGRSMRVRLCTKCQRRFKVQNLKLKSSEVSSIAPAVAGLI